MSNTLDPLSPIPFAKRIQKNLNKKAIYTDLANFDVLPGLTFGKSVDRPYISTVKAELYSPDTALIKQDVTGTTDPITIDREPSVWFFLDDRHKKQNAYDTRREIAEEVSKKIKTFQDAEFLSKVIEATDTIDDSDMSGGTAGDHFSLTENNIDKLFRLARKELRLNDVEDEGDWFVVLPPTAESYLWQRVSDKNSAFGDSSSEKGFMGSYNGFKVYISNNLCSSARWTPANQPTDGDYITINGITFTGETGALDAAGKFKIETDLATTLKHLAAGINAHGATVSGSFYAVSDDNKLTMQSWYAVAADTYITVYVFGGSESITVTASETNDPWSHETCHIFFGKRKCVDMIVQSDYSIEEGRAVVNGKKGSEFISSILYGCDTPVKGKEKMVNALMSIA